MVRLHSIVSAVGRLSVERLAGQDLLALDRQVCFALSVASRSVISVYRPLLEPLGLTHPQYLAMLSLWEHEPLSVTQLSRLLQLEPATLSPLLKRLESVGLLTRTRDRQDERTLRITLTPAGRELRTRALEIPPAVMARLEMTAGELADLHHLLTRLIGQAQRAVVGAAADRTAVS